MHSTVRILAVLVITGLIVGLEALRLSRQRVTEKFQLTQRLEETRNSAGEVECFGAQPPFIKATHEPTFIDVTRSWGLEFRHVVGPLGTYFMPESIGTGGAFLDYDGDGRLDLFLVQSDRSPDAAGDFPPKTKLGSRLFHQTAEGTFEDLTEQSGMDGSGYGVGCAVGDVDNDGDPDIYVTRYAQDSLYLNNADGTFTDATRSSGIRENDWGTCAAFFDYNRDGRLDLVVVNYTADPQYGHSVACGFRRGLVSYCSPHKFHPTVDRLFRNDGVQPNESGTGSVKFTDVTEASGLGAATTYGFGVVCTDVNSDGWPDIFVANDGAANRLWINQRNGKFTEEATERGCATNGDGGVEAGMGAALADINHDGRLDFIVTHLSGEKATLYLAKQGGDFEDASRLSGIIEPTTRHTGWGVGLIDFDHDGELDCAMANGLVIPCHSGFPPHGEDQFQVRRDVIRDPNAYWRDYADQNILMMGRGQCRFRDATERGGAFCENAGSGRALIHGDIDNDGDIDLVVTNCGGIARLYRNDFRKAGHWLLVRAFDPTWNRDAYGAEITLRAGDKTYTGSVNPASSYLASNDERVHFGLGDVESYEEIIVKWPDGPIEAAHEIFDGDKTNRLITLRRGDGHGLRENQ